MLSATVHGLDELQRLLKTLPGQLSTKVVRQALHAAAKIGVKALRDEAALHDDRGEIRVNLRTLKRRIAHLSDSAVAVTRQYGNGILYTAVGFEWPTGAAGWLVEHGHRMVVGGTVARIQGKTPKAANENPDRGRPRARPRQTAPDRIAGVQAEPAGDGRSLPGRRAGGRGTTRARLRGVGCQTAYT